MKFRTAWLSAALTAAANTACAQVTVWPAKPIRVIVPFETGSTTDTLARIIAGGLTELWRQQIVVDNRGGAGGNIATEMVAKAAADGYTLLMAAASHAINPSLYHNPGYDVTRDFAPVTLVGSAPQLLVANPALQAASIGELIALARSRPGRINFASAGSGSPSHLTMERFKSMAGIDLVHIPYKGGRPVLTALLSDEVQLYAGNIRAMMPQVKAGKLRALAVTGAARSPAAPEVPTVAESGLPGFSVLAWWGLLAPARTPAYIVDKLQREVARQLQAPALRERLALDAIEAIGSTPQAFDAFIRKELATWAKVVKDSGARAE